MAALVALLILSVYSKMHELAINEHSRAGRASPPAAHQEPTAKPHQARWIQAANPQRATSGKTHPDP